MKKAILAISILTLLGAGCKSNNGSGSKTPEEKKAETIVKSDKEKSDSVLKHYQDMMQTVPDSLPEMKSK